ncbi:hypothetical protein C1645_811580 [Glomus cerebriforme]|uniref:F-box domain-containing protein n=1 Tax=Glomus cerebriforme TaxID=658196 RepID=A0A397TVZ8_9GLOM|nr:hypothetical protein C1645_811580 [Glomus cerebriforme]
MSCQLPTDCLNEIFEYLEDDKNTLYSCLLTNRFWCEIAVRILWKDIWNFINHRSYQTHVPLTIISTLVAGLPNESKEILYKNGIFISSPTSKPLLFNYASFCKVLSILGISRIIRHILEKQQFITSRNLNYCQYLILYEILKMFMNEVSSLKSLDYDLGNPIEIQDITFTFFPGAKNCLKDLSELICSSDIHYEFFYQLSQICHNIQSLTIEFGETISNGITDLISLQKNLKHVTLIYYSYKEYGTEITTSLTKFSSSLTKLIIKEKGSYTPLSFISTFTNLQELILSFEFGGFDFNRLQYVTFSQLKVLKFLCTIPEVDMLIKFLEINGKNLKELYMRDSYSLLNSAIAKFCPNLKSLFTIFLDDELETLKMILNNCQYLESIKVWCGDYYLNEKDLLNIIANYSPKTFYELKIVFDGEESKLVSNDLESFFISWKNRLSQLPLSLIIIKDHESISLEVNEDNMKVIKKYMKMGFLKKFRTKQYYEELEFI